MTYEVMDGPVSSKLYENFGEGLINMFAVLNTGEASEQSKAAVGAALAELGASLDAGQIPEPRFPILTIRASGEEAPAEETSEEAPAEETSEEAPAEEASEEAPAEGGEDSESNS